MRASLFLLGTALALGACVGDGDEAAVDEIALEVGPSQCPDGPPWLVQFDANGDHVLQLTELPERLRGRLASADSDGDGALTRAEVQAMMRARAEARFDYADANGDGVLTEDEVGDPGRWDRIALADGDGDSAVTLDELRQAFADGVISPRCHGERPGGGGPGHGRPH